MAYLQTVPAREAAGEVKAMYDKDLAAQGYVANYTRTFSLRPEAQQGWLALKDAITSGMDPRLYELATVAAATAIVIAAVSILSSHGNSSPNLRTCARKSSTVFKDGIRTSSKSCCSIGRSLTTNAPLANGVLT